MNKFFVSIKKKLIGKFFSKSNNDEVIQSPEVLKVINTLRSLDKTHLNISKKMFEAAGGLFYPLDILANASLNRSLSLLHAFCDLIEKKNFMSAAALLRLQLDNCFRLHAAWLVKDPHDFSVKIFEGTHVRKLKDKNGNYMTDRYLVKKLSKYEPKLIGLYEDTSGYIHLSDKHIYNTSQLDEKGEMIIKFKISPRDEFIDDGTYISALSAFNDVTAILFRLILGWIQTKEQNFNQSSK